MKAVLNCGDMRTNGTLQYNIHTGGGFNDEGEPVASVDTWSEEVRCFIRTATNNTGRYEDGTFIQASYEVLVESGQVPLEANRVKLTRGATELGDFAVQGRPLLTAMDRIKIVV